MITLDDSTRDKLLEAIHLYASHSSEERYWKGRGMPRAAQACRNAASARLDLILDILLPEEEITLDVDAADPADSPRV